LDHARNKGPVRPSVSTGSEQSRQTGASAAASAAASERGDRSGEGRASGREDVPPVSRFPSHPKVVVTRERDPPCAGEEGTSAGGRRASTLFPLTREFISPRSKRFLSLICARGS
jgi:hypothetical protein